MTITALRAGHDSDSCGTHENDLRVWTELLAPLTSSPDGIATGRALLASWADPSRRYHDLTHPRQVLTGVDELAAHASDLDAVRLGTTGP